MSIKTSIFTENYNTPHNVTPFLSDYITIILDFLNNEIDDSNLGHFFVRQNDIITNSIADIIDNKADLNFLSEEWNDIWAELATDSHWNESYKNALSTYKTIFIDHIWPTAFHWTYDDIEKADAGFDFSDIYVKPQKNINGETYKQTRTSDLVEQGVAKNKRHLQFTHKQNESWIRLIIPSNPRRVEIEELDRNFWVIGQVLSAICEYLFDENSPIKDMFQRCLREITEQWENMLYLWADYYLLTGRINNIKLILDLPNDELHPYRKFDNFDISNLTTTILEKRFNFLLGKYSRSKISLLVRVRKENYYHNYYSREEYPYYGYYNGQKWTWFEIKYSDNSFAFDISNLNNTGYQNEIYGINIGDTEISYGTYGTNYPIAAIRIIPEITQGGANPELKFIVRDAAGEAVGKVEKDTVVKSYTGKLNESGSLEITKDTITEPTASGSGTVAIADIEYPFYGGEVVSVGIKKVIK